MTRMSDSDKQSFFHAIQNEKIRTIMGYLDTGYNFNDPDDEGFTPLMRAVFIDKEDIRSYIVRLLVRHGCDVNFQDDKGCTALIHACILNDRNDVIRRLVCTGSCDPNLSDKNQNVALWHAAANGNPSAIRILINDAHCKDILKVDTVNCSGDSPLSEAVTKGHAECVQILVNEGGANVKLIKDQIKLKIILKPNPDEFESNQEDRDVPQSAQSVGGMSLHLDKISIHSGTGLYSTGLWSAFEETNNFSSITPVDGSDSVKESRKVITESDKIQQGLPILDALSNHSDSYQMHSHTAQVHRPVDDLEPSVSIISYNALSSSSNINWTPACPTGFFYAMGMTGKVLRSAWMLPPLQTKGLMRTISDDGTIMAVCATNNDNRKQSDKKSKKVQKSKSSHALLKH